MKKPLILPWGGPKSFRPFPSNIVRLTGRSLVADNIVAVASEENALRAPLLVRPPAWISLMPPLFGALPLPPMARVGFEENLLSGSTDAHDERLKRKHGFPATKEFTSSISQWAMAWA